MSKISPVFVNLAHSCNLNCRQGIEVSMNEGAPMMYHGSGAFGGPGQMFMMGGQERTARPYPLDGLPSLAGSPAGHATPRRWQPRRDRHPNAKAAGDNTAFGYDSDDSSLSSNASGSNKSGEKGKTFKFVISMFC